MPQSSIGTDSTPTAVTPSTNSNGPPFRVSAAISRTGWSVVVDVSLAWMSTPLVSGCAWSACSTALTSTAVPHSTLISTTSRPKARHMRSHRSPNLPPLTTMTLSFAENRLVTAASMAPVPEEARMITSFFVPNRVFNPCRASSRTTANAGVR